VSAPVVVPDASVLLKWSLVSTAEKDREKALAIRMLWITGRLRIVLPSLWIYEVGNVLGMLKPDVAGELLEIYVQYEFEEESAHELHSTILEIMSRASVTFYDAAYHSVALKHRGIYISADDKYVRKAKVMGSVISLKDWEAE
jgi:predicted nucleic acid-binding protein